jgi:membrane-bound serine protease (ClpP class)
MKITIVIPIVLQLLGVIVILAEFLIPSFGILSLTAAGLFGFSIYYVFAHFSPQTGVVFLVLDAILIPFLIALGIKLLSRSRFSLKTELSQKAGVTSQSENLIKLVGLSGKTVTILRPAGKAIIDGKKYDVVSVGDYIGQDAAVEVAEVSGNRIVVRIKDENTK